MNAKKKQIVRIVEFYEDGTCAAFDMIGNAAPASPVAPISPIAPTAPVTPELSPTHIRYGAGETDRTIAPRRQTASVKAAKAAAAKPLRPIVDVVIDLLKAAPDGLTISQVWTELGRLDLRYQSLMSRKSFGSLMWKWAMELDEYPVWKDDSKNGVYFYEKA